MKGIRSSQALGTLFVMILATTAVAATPYEVGYTWNRYNDWVPGTSNGSPAGNPCKDSEGNPVWSAEYINNVPAGSDLDSAKPWYKLASSGLMVWDSHWSGGAWARLYDTPPQVSRGNILHVTVDQAYRGDHYANVPLLRWQNPSSTPMTVSLTSGADFLGAIGTGHPAGSTSDIIIARTDASDGDSVHLLYSTTMVRTWAPGELGQYFALPALAVDELVLDPGDDIIFSIRSRTRVVGDSRYLNVPFFDDVTITVVPEPATLSLLGLGGLAMLRRRRRK